MMNMEKLASILLSVDISKRTRLRLSVTYEGHRRILTAVSPLPESEAVAYFLDPRNCQHLTVHAAEAIPFALAYIVDQDGNLIDDCQLEQVEDESLMVEDFLRCHTCHKNRYYLVRATEFKGVRTIHDVIALDKERIFENVTA